ncbi:MAG: hypothetical protein AB7I25_11930 [Vicinamibacterales bacterium]
MPSRSRPTQAKRAREKALIEKRQMKSARRIESKDRKANSPRPEGEDPDIAGIVLGPQPHPFLTEEELNDDGTLAEDGERVEDE